MNPQQLGQMDSYMQTLQQQQPNNTYLNPNPVGATQQPIPAQGGKFPANPQVSAPVMPRPVMPRPTMTRPSLIGAGLAGLRGRR
jgi:hypothetical protein